MNAPNIARRLTAVLATVALLLNLAAPALAGPALDAARAALVSHPSFWLYAQAQGISVSSEPAVLTGAWAAFKRNEHLITYQVQLSFLTGVPTDLDNLNIAELNARLADPRVTAAVSYDKLIVHLPEDLYASLAGTLFAGTEPVPAPNYVEKALVGFATGTLGVGVGVAVLKGGTIVGNPVVMAVGVAITGVSAGVLLFSMKQAQNWQDSTKIFKDVDALCWPMTASCRFSEPVIPPVPMQIPQGYVPVVQCSRPAGPWGNPQFRKDKVTVGYMIDAMSDPTWTCEFAGEFARP